MKISIIVPVYNVELYLDQCLKSILSQSYANFQLILINDGSTDCSLQICQKFAALDSRILLIDKVNEGVSVARNVGITNALGDWICFVDSDDTILPNYLENLINNSFNSKLVISGVNIFDQLTGNNKSVLSSEFGIFNLRTDEILNIIPLLLISSPYAKLFQKDILMKYDIKFDERISIGEDYIFVATYLTVIDSCSLIPNSDYNYIRRGGSLSTSYDCTFDELVSEGEIYRATVKLFSKFNYSLKEVNGIYYDEFKKHSYRVLYSLYKNRKENYSKNDRISIIRNMDKSQISRLKKMFKRSGFRGYILSLFFNAIVVRSFDRYIDIVIKNRLN